MELGPVRNQDPDEDAQKIQTVGQAVDDARAPVAAPPRGGPSSARIVTLPAERLETSSRTLRGRQTARRRTSGWSSWATACSSWRCRPLRPPTRTSARDASRRFGRTSSRARAARRSRASSISARGSPTTRRSIPADELDRLAAQPERSGGAARGGARSDLPGARLRGGRGRSCRRFDAGIEYALTNVRRPQDGAASASCSSVLWSTWVVSAYSMRGVNASHDRPLDRLEAVLQVDRCERRLEQRREDVPVELAAGRAPPPGCPARTRRAASPRSSSRATDGAARARDDV